jgi:hypothetical protein
MVFYRRGAIHAIGGFVMIRLATCALVLGLIGAGSATLAQDAQKKDRRFGYDVDEVTFAQKTPAETMASITKALDRKRVDYLLAQMADPNYVDYWVERYKADFSDKKEVARRLRAFDRLVRETTDYFNNDPLIVRELRVFAKGAKWEEKDDVAIGTVDSVPGRKVFLKKIGERWFLKNEQQ